MKIDIKDKNTLTLMVSILVAVPAILLMLTFIKYPQDWDFYIHSGFIVSIFILFCISLVQNHLEKHKALEITTKSFQEKNELLAEEIGHRQQIQKALEYSETRLKTILNAVKTCIVIIDSKTHEIIEVNPAAAALIGTTKDEIIGKRCYDYICPAHENCCPVTDTGCVIYDAERILKRCDGTDVPVIKTITAVKLGGRDCLLESFVDITEQKTVEKQLQRAKDLAEASVETKSQFLANMSHEIRTPMNAIIGFGSLLLEEELSEAQQNYVEIIYTSSKNLLTIINDILDFSKIEAGKMNIEQEICDLDHLLDEMQHLMKPIADKKNIGYQINISSDMPKTIISDMGRLRQCLINLVNNAIKFTEHGYVHINAGLKQIHEKPYIYFAVEDTGIGIPASRQDDIFKSFTQADGSTCREYGGTGLGLTITKQLSRLLGGDLTLNSTAGQGSVFTLSIPATVPIDIAESVDNQEEKTKSDTSAKIALVAEDSFTNQTLIRLLLKKEGYEVEIAANGKDAVEMAAANNYDIILMDMHMPIMNGDEAAKQIIDSGNPTSIIAMTADSQDEVSKSGGSNWYTDYLSKPIDREKLAEVLEKYSLQKSR